MTPDLLAVATDLGRRHRPYVLATVVWSRRPTSGRQGSHAIIEADGTVHGWIGGACAEPTVLREARRVMNDGAPKLLHLGPEHELDAPLRGDVLQVPIACASEGALEVFMEPVLPQPHVVLVGRSPAVRTLVELLAALDWRVGVVDPGPEDLAPTVPVVASLADAGVDGATAVVVATQGHDDEAALEAALATDAAWIGLVASRRRGETLLGYLRDRGYDAAQLERIRTPAGLDLGRVEHREIGVAILAELVALKAAGDLVGPGAGVAPEPTTATDPVCGMEVEVAAARFASQHQGQRIVFCCPACKRLFDEDPARYLDPERT
jgi:xanthine dehydrogenase accessory factor